MQKIIIGATLALSLALLPPLSGQLRHFPPRKCQRSVRLEGHRSVRPGSRERRRPQEAPHLECLHLRQLRVTCRTPKPVAPAGENAATTFLTTSSRSRLTAGSKPGLAVSFSPTGQGLADELRASRGSATTACTSFSADATFVDQWIATLDRTDAHRFRFVTTFVHGHDNDVVRVIIDGDQKVLRWLVGELLPQFEERTTRPRAIVCCMRYAIRQPLPRYTRGHRLPVR